MKRLEAKGKVLKEFSISQRDGLSGFEGKVDVIAMNAPNPDQSVQEDGTGTMTVESTQKILNDVKRIIEENQDTRVLFRVTLEEEGSQTLWPGLISSAGLDYKIILEHNDPRYEDDQVAKPYFQAIIEIFLPQNKIKNSLVIIASCH